jgi:uncharacterized membrane protein
MYRSVEEYLDALKKEMQGFDSATMQDALTDAEEHLRTALETARESQPEMDAADTLPAIIEQYGSPEETAAAYAEVGWDVSSGSTQTRRLGARYCIC